MKLYKKIEGGVCDCEYPCSCDAPRYIEASRADIARALREYTAADIGKYGGRDAHKA